MINNNSAKKIITFDSYSDDAEYTNVNAGKIQKALKRLIEVLGFSQNQLSRKIEISSSVLSQILKAKYEYDKDNSVWVQIEKFLNEINGDIFETELYTKVHKILNQTFKEKIITVITSASGAGKTLAAKRYCFINHDAMQIRITEVFNVKFLLQKMMQSVDAEWEGYSKQHMFESLSDMLRKKPRLFVIDEAERLHVPELETLRDLYDQGNIGLCLIGQEILRKVLQEGHTRKKDLVQLYSRIAFSKVVNILTPKDIIMVFDKFCPDYDLSENKIKKLSSYYAAKGGIRAIENIAKYAAKNAKKYEYTVNDEFIDNVISKISL